MFIPLFINRISLAILSQCWLKTQNSHRFPSNNILEELPFYIHCIFYVTIIIGNHCWRHGGIDLKLKRQFIFGVQLNHLSCLPKENLVFNFKSIIPTLCLQQWLSIIIETQCRIFTLQVLDKNRLLKLILSWFLQVFSKGTWWENNAVVIVFFMTFPLKFSISQREVSVGIHFYLSKVK